MAPAVNDIKIQINHFVSLLVTCILRINGDYFAPAAACQYLNFL